ncbi:hypothetical protein FB451DRAFT_1174731 [Mycena latifolia]|nr:hypothetical protein FB451DRAFT_1174731 [Mycena latifolia]
MLFCASGGTAACFSFTALFKYLLAHVSFARALLSLPANPTLWLLQQPLKSSKWRDVVEQGWGICLPPPPTLRHSAICASFLGRPLQDHKPRPGTLTVVGLTATSPYMFPYPLWPPPPPPSTLSHHRPHLRVRRAAAAVIGTAVLGIARFIGSPFGLVVINESWS